MQTYSEYAPTSFDVKGLALPDQGDWLVLIGRNRDSDHLTESNFDTALDMLGGESDDVEVHRFRHWACGWLEIIIVRPGTDGAAKAEEIGARLADYLVLNEDDFSKREYESYCGQWESWGAREFRSELVRKFELNEAGEDMLDAVSNDRLLKLFESLNESGDWYDSDGSPVIRRSVDRATIEDVTEFLESIT